MIGLRSVGTAAGGFIAPGSAFVLAALYVPWMPDPNVARWGVVFLAALASSIVMMRAPIDRVTLAAAAFVAWCGLSIAWSPDRLASWDVFTKIAAVAVIFLALRGMAARWVATALAAGVIFAAATGAPYFGSGNPEFAAQLAVVVAPLGGLLLLIALPMVLGSMLPLSLGIVAPLLFRRWWARLFVASSLTVAAGFVVTHSTEAWTGVGTRLDVFAGVVAAWLQAPLWGHGIGSFVYVYPDFAGVGASLGLIPYSVEITTQATAAHNEFLQLLMETGLVGLALAGWVAWEIWRGAGQHWGARAALIGAGIMSLTGFPLQNPVIAVAVAYAASRLVMGPASSRAWRPVVVVCAGLLLIPVTLTPSKVLAQAHFSAARRYYHAEVISQQAAAVAALYHANAAYELDPANQQIRLAVFQAAALTYDRWPSAESRAGVDAAWRVAQSASPHDSLAMMTRLRMLIAGQECFTNRDCDRLANDLVRTASRKQEVRRLMEIYG